MKLCSIFFYFIHHHFFFPNRVFQNLTRRSADISKIFDSQSIITPYNRIINIIDFYIVRRRLDIIIEFIILFIKFSNFIDLLEILQLSQLPYFMLYCQISKKIVVFVLIATTIFEYLTCNLMKIIFASLRKIYISVLLIILVLIAD